MSAQKISNKINLLPTTEFATSTWGRVLAWALSTFRVIVILTLMVVQLAFMSRFWLDAKSNDLNDSIRQKSSVIASWKDFEKEFKTTQKKLAIFNQVATGEDLVSSALDKITSYLPQEIILTSYSFSPTSIEIKGQTANEMAVAQLATNLNSDTQFFSKIIIKNISTNTENPAIFDFGLIFNLAKENKK